MAKKDLQKKAVVLGLRATPEGRAWMNMKASDRGISLQAFFDEVMQQQAGSPWLKSDESLMPVPSALRDLVADVLFTFRHGMGESVEALEAHIRTITKNTRKRLDAEKQQELTPARAARASHPQLLEAAGAKRKAPRTPPA